MTTYLTQRLFLMAYCCIFHTAVFGQLNSFVQNEFIIKWKTTTSRTKTLEPKLQLQAKKIKSFSNKKIELWKIEQNAFSDVFSLIKEYEDHPSIEYIEPNYRCSGMGIIPNDSQFNNQWALGLNDQILGINASEGWMLKKESPTIKVAIIDSGVDWQHPDLVDNIWQNLGEDVDGDGRVLEWNGTQWIFDPGDENGIDDDNNGYADDFIGWDFINNDNNPWDDYFHGTHVAGLLGAKGNNGIGIAGVTWSVQMVPLKFINAENQGTLIGAIAAIDYALQNDIPISNNSWGNMPHSNILRSAIQNAAQQGHLFIAAAGNEGTDNDSNPNYPSSYDLDNIIAVAASDRNDVLISTSNYGASSVDLCAPGQDLLSCRPNRAYDRASGTSTAAPLVAGACALLWDKYPTKNYQEIREIVLNTVDENSSLNSKIFSGGRLNLFELLGETASCVYRDSLILIDFYHSTNGSNWFNNDNWLSDRPLGEWYGVNTNAQGCVIDLDMDGCDIRSCIGGGNNLQGVLLPNLGQLTSLQFVDLKFNNLTGEIPSTLGQLAFLTYLNLQDNNLTGAIPSALGQMNSLTDLILGDNNLNGSLPLELNNLSNLTWLDLRENNLTGTIPVAYANLIRLNALFLQNNQLTSTIPKEISQLVNLRYLGLDNNQLDGSIPREIGLLTNLTYLNLSNNQLNGLIPEELARLTNLEQFRLDNNNLSGCFPSLFNSLCYLTNTNVSYCDQINEPLEGCQYDFRNNPNLPNGGDFSAFCTNGIGVCPPCRTTDSLVLVALYNSTNGFNWTNNTNWLSNRPLSEWYGVTTNAQGCVERLNLYSNGLIGFITPELGNLSNLIELNLFNNRLYGAIPPSLGNLINLEILFLYNNQLSGSIPAELGNLSKLLSLHLYDNFLSGAIPPELENLSNLQILNLSNNFLSGAIPPKLGNLSNLQILNLSNNFLSGAVPEELGFLNSLTFLALNNNNLSGCFHQSFNNLCTITYNFANNFGLPNGGDFTNFCTNETGSCVNAVWPGDFNNDGIVNNIDAIYWGLACENTIGFFRLNASTLWLPQNALDWPTAVNQVNKKHQDGNGDGIINVADLQVLENNYGQMHSISTTGAMTNQVAFRLESLGYIPSGRHEYAVHVELDNTPVSLHGLGGTVNLGNMPITSAWLDISGSSMQPHQVVQNFNPETNNLEFALTRTDKIDQLCDGSIATLIIIMDNLTLTDEPMTLNIEQGRQMAASGYFTGIASTTIYDSYSDVTLASGDLMVTASAMHKSCDMDGYAMVSMKGGQLPYNVQWSTGETTPKITNLDIGNYTVTVQDATGEQRAFSVNVKGELLPVYDENGNMMDCNCSSLNLNSNPIASNIYEGSNVQSAGIINSGSIVAIQASNSIELKPDFYVASGAEFTATIGPCSSTNNQNVVSDPVTYKSLPADQKSPLEEIDFQIIPNPIKGQATVNFQSDCRCQAELMVFNFNGQLVIEKNINSSKGWNTTQVDANLLPAGMYLVFMKINGNYVRKKVAIVK